MIHRALAAALVVCAATACTPSDGKPPTAACPQLGVGDPTAGGAAVHVLINGKLVRLPAPKAGEGFGAAVTLAQVDGDGCADVVVGAPYAADGAGAVYILYGGAARPASKLVSPKPRAGALFGWSLAAHGDLIAIGAPGEYGAKGAVHVARQGAIVRTIHQDTRGVPGNGDAYDQFGYQVALGPLASGRIGLAVGAPYEMADGAAPGEGEAGAVTVIDDVEAKALTGVRLVPPATDDAGLCGFGHSLVYAKGFAVGASDCGKVQFYGQDLQPTRTVTRPRSALAHEPVRLAASKDGQVAALWPGPSPVLSVLSKQLPARGLESGLSVAFNGDAVLIGRYGTPAVVSVAS